MMNKRRTLSIITLLVMNLLVTILSITSATAHGIGYAQLNNVRTVTLEFKYSGADPATYAAVKVYAPQNTANNADPDTKGAKDTKEIEYQNGRTDAAGRFSFVPDRPGQWRVIVTDGQGHRAEAVVEHAAPAHINALNIDKAVGIAADLFSRDLSKALFGLSLFLNILVVYYLVRKKLEGKRDKNAHQ